jgi:hypothetical protein
MSKWSLPVLVGITLSFLLSVSVFADEIVSTMADQKEVAVTIYNENLALIRDQRQVDMPEGTVNLALREVSARIRPETALLSSLTRPGGLTILEQNFDFDLLTPGRGNCWKNTSVKMCNWFVRTPRRVRIFSKRPASSLQTVASFCRLAIVSRRVLLVDWFFLMCRKICVIVRPWR